jgi:hypothetical protein
MAETRMKDSMENESEFQGMAIQRITNRDRQLFGLLAVARYFSTEQIGRLFFPGRAMRTVRRRLSRLSGEAAGYRGQAHVRQVPYNDERHEPRSAWTLTGHGYSLADREGSNLKFFRDDSADVARAVDVSEVLVRLAPAGRGGIAQVPRAFTWTNGDAMVLHHAQVQRGAPVLGRLRADAILAIPSLKRRIFIEQAPGTHVPEATGNRVRRYTWFLTERPTAARGTHYECAFPDGFRPEVVFLACNAIVRSNVNRMIAESRRADGRPEVSVRAVTHDDLAAELGPLVDARAPGPAAPTAADRSRVAASAEEEVLRPGRVAVRGEQLVNFERALRTAIEALALAQRAMAKLGVPQEAIPRAPEVGGVWRVAVAYARRGNEALARFGLKEAE